MFTLTTTYVDFSKSVKAQTMTDTYEDTDAIKKRIHCVRVHAMNSQTTALKSMTVHEGEELKFSWSAKTGWKQF